MGYIVGNPLEGEGMRADIELIPRDVPNRKGEGKVFVVIDVLRATTTIIEALSNGCTDVTGEETLIGGERGGLKVDGFDLGNAPREYSRDVVSGKRVILTTTNGTRALQSVAGCELVFVAGFTNAHAVVQRCIALKADPVIIPAGREGKFSLEDVVCGGMMMDLLKREGVVLTDGARASCILYKAFAHDLLEMARNSEHGRELIRLGLEEDLAFCVQTNVSVLVPVFREGSLTVD
jgi:2-phosphosulfolactate phosphatase